MSPKEEASYMPVPTDIHVAVKAQPEERRRGSNVLRLFGILLLVTCLFQSCL